MWPCYHLHTRFCDGKNTVAEWAAALRQNGVSSAGLSSHAPLPPAVSRAWAMDASQLGTYLAEIRAASCERLQLYAGLEADYVAGLTGPRDFAGQTDYTIGSIHLLGVLADGTPWEVDMRTAGFREGVRQRFDMNYREAVCAYFAALREMLLRSPPTIVGHLDKIKIHNRPSALFDETAPWYREQVMETLHAIRRQDVMLEVNTRGWYQNKTTDPYPSRWIMEEAHRLKIPVVLSSDAHQTDELHLFFGETTRWLESIGFRELMALKDGAWRAFPWTNAGLVWA